MSVTFPGYAQSVYPPKNFNIQPPLQATSASLGNPVTPTYPPALPDFTKDPAGFPDPHGFPASPSLPQTSQQYKALAKAAALLTPAVLLARFAPAQAETTIKEWFPSDWKVWAKLGLGVASMSQMNKAFNWTPPAWLGAFMNVTLMAGLMTGFAKGGLKNSARIIAILGPSMAALVQATQFAANHLEKPLQEKYDIPPTATRLALSIASMGAGFAALPKIFEVCQPLLPSIFQEAEATTVTARHPHSNPANTRATVTGGCACCGTPICLNETANYGATAIDSIKRHFAPPKQDQP